MLAPVVATVAAVAAFGLSPAAGDAAATERYAFPIRGCSASYAHVHHDYPATDIMAARGCPVVATTSGRIDEVSFSDTWNSKSNDGATRGGLSVSLVGDDGGKAPFDEPGGLSYANGKLYVADTNHHRIAVIDLRTREVSTLELQGVEAPRR